MDTQSPLTQLKAKQSDLIQGVLELENLQTELEKMNEKKKEMESKMYEKSSAYLASPRVVGIQFMTSRGRRVRGRNANIYGRYVNDDYVNLDKRMDALDKNLKEAAQKKKEKKLTIRKAAGGILNILNKL